MYYNRLQHAKIAEQKQLEQNQERETAEVELIRLKEELTSTPETQIGKRLGLEQRIKKLKRGDFPQVPTILRG